MPSASKDAIDSLVSKIETLDLNAAEVAVLDDLLSAAEESREVEGFWDPGEYSPSKTFGLPDLRGRMLRVAGTPKGVVINHEEQ